MAREMKNSGVEWIGEIPVGWEVVRTKNCYSHRKQIAGDTADNYERLALTLSGVIKRPKNDSTGLQPKEFNRYQILRENELVFKLIDLENISTSRVGYSPYTGIVSPAYIILNPNNVNESKYGEYFFLSMWQREVFNHMGDDGVRSSLNSGDLLNIPYLSIPNDEQIKIASFLDQKCAEIDAVIEKTKATIEEYKKLKQSVITEAVTKGIRGNRPMKDSGIEWIGEIPVGWEVSRIKFVSSFEPTVDKTNLQENSIITYTPMDCIKNGYFINNTAPLKSISSSLTAYQEGDIVMAKVTPCFENGNIAIMKNLSSGVGLGSSELFVFRAENINTKYFFYWLRNKKFIQNACSTMTGTGGLKRVSPTFVKNCFLHLPPTDEQKEISDYLDQKCAEIDTLIAKKTTLLTELETYKKSLIYEYVTGKKEVGEDNVSTQVAVYSPYFPVIIKVNNLYNALKAFMFGILDKCNYDTGRVKLEKMMFVAQHSIGCDLGNEYSRAELGPLDSLFYQCEYDLVKDGCIIKDKKRNIRRIYYKPGRNNHKYKEEYNRYFAGCDTEIDRIINIFKDYDVQKSERIATLFGAWNDAIIDKRQFTDEDIVEDVLNNWHEHKGDYSRKEWLEDLEEMKKINLIPKGYGKKTVIKND